jgi:hypothetical protein
MFNVFLQKPAPRNFSKSGGGAMASGGELTVRVIALQ